MKTVLIISFTDLARDPRVNRQIRFIKDNYRVIAVGTGDPGIPDIRYINCTPLKKSIVRKIIKVGHVLLKKYEENYWSKKHIIECLEKLHDIDADVIIANDIESLPLAIEVAKGAKIILDAHEYSPRQFEDLWHWRLFNQGLQKYLCAKYIPRADAMMTVCQGIADEYHRNYGVRPSVVTNARGHHNILPRPTDPKRIRIIHHGGAAKSRKIENMIKMMDHLDNRFELDLILVPGSKRYIQKLIKMARYNSRIRFVDPVPMRQLVPFLSQYDIGLYILEPTNFNNQNALPNKLFEFIQARLALAIGPSPEMARIVKTYDCGVVGDDFSPETLARQIGQLDEKKIDYYKNQSHKTAKIVSSEQNRETILKMIEGLDK